MFNGCFLSFNISLIVALIAESLPEESDEAGNDASVQLSPSAGSVWGPPGRYGQTPVLPWLWTFLQNGEGNLSTLVVCRCYTPNKPLHDWHVYMRPVLRAHSELLVSVIWFDTSFENEIILHDLIDWFGQKIHGSVKSFNQSHGITLWLAAVVMSDD